MRNRLLGLGVCLWLRDRFSLWLRDRFSLWLRDRLRSRRCLGLADATWLCGGDRLYLSLRSHRGLWSFNRLSYGLLGCRGWSYLGSSSLRSHRGLWSFDWLFYELDHGRHRASQRNLHLDPV